VDVLTNLQLCACLEVIHECVEGTSLIFVPPAKFYFRNLCVVVDVDFFTEFFYNQPSLGRVVR